LSEFHFTRKVVNPCEILLGVESFKPI